LPLGHEDDNIQHCSPAAQPSAQAQADAAHPAEVAVRLLAQVHGSAACPAHAALAAAQVLAHAAHPAQLAAQLSAQLLLEFATLK